MDGFTAPELVVEHCLRRGMKLLAQDPDQLAPALLRYSDAGRQEIAEFLRTTPIPVVDGWPTISTQVPCITVMLRPEQEDASRQPVGMLAQSLVGGQVVTAYAHPFGSNVECAIYGNTQREASIIATAVKWLLLQSRQALEGDGLMEQRLTIADYEPAPSLFDDTTYWFIRTVTLDCVTIDVIEIVEGDPLLEIGVAVDSVQANILPRPPA